MENLVYLFNFLGCAQIIVVQLLSKRTALMQEVAVYDETICEA